MRDIDGRADLHRITAATLVLAGEQDCLASAADARALTDGITAATISPFPGSGHLINVEQPARFVAEIFDFLLRSGS